MKTASAIHVKFANVFADALLEYMRTDIVQGINYLPDKADFKYFALDHDSSPEDIGFRVGSQWADFVKGLKDPSIKQELGYDPAALRSVIVKKISGNDVVGQLAEAMTIREIE